MTFTTSFTAAPDDIDELGHVNNAVWVRWIQDLAVAHWDAVAPAEHREAFVWVVTRHEIDYRGNLVVGGRASGETWVPEPPRGARFDRHFRFTGEDGRVLVEGVTTWAMLDRASGRLVRIRPEVAAPFFDGMPE
ncbi:acyl-CoA thioesterase [Sphingomonas jeddahensis]|uniref:Acyl-ACP thioesterase n=1 Tax=Sphingomonas jeddahensis TaxID=1915074 RepID=A0A1V2EUC4_9SPHN|nr:acyl-CoA thioesterase [Sphingomonas jeddahensis]ONF96085.1 Acyl-ACP thioesterase [Sphingomonas jeddahensis]